MTEDGRRSVLRAAFCVRVPCRLRHFQIFRGRLSAVGHELIFHILALVERAQACTFHSRDMDEHVLIAGGRADESIAFGWIKPFDGAPLHRLPPHQQVTSDASRDRSRSALQPGLWNDPKLMRPQTARTIAAATKIRLLASKFQKCGCTMASGQRRTVQQQRLLRDPRSRTHTNSSRNFARAIQINDAPFTDAMGPCDRENDWIARSTDQRPSRRLN